MLLGKTTSCLANCLAKCLTNCLAKANGLDKVAQQRNADRDRKLPEKIVKKIWTDVQKNMGKFQGLFGTNFIIIDNSEKRTTQRDPKAGVVIFPKKFYSAMNKFIKSPVKSGLAKRWIKRQMELKKKVAA